MPQIPPDLIQSVVILLSEADRQVGTAFVMKHVVVDSDFFDSFYLITCEHCVENRVKARFNDGSVLTIEPNEWRKSPSGDDVVANDVTSLVDRAQGPIGCINTGLTVGRGEPFFGIGTELYMLGLLVDEVEGKVSTNAPRARFGNLSAFADDQFRVRQGNNAERPCHLGDMRSRTGFSGSPVIGYLEIPVLDGGFAYKNLLFGVHSAQHQERIKIYTESSCKVAEIPSSMTRIVPAWIILELIEKDEVLIRHRDRRRSEVGGQLGITSTGNCDARQD